MKKNKLVFALCAISLVSVSAFSMDDVSSYEKRLRELAAGDLFQANTMFDKSWDSLSDLLSTHVTESMHRKQEMLVRNLSTNGLNVYSKRTQPKSMERITGRKAGFRAASDLLAVRLQRNSQIGIERAIDELGQMVVSEGGKIFLKPLYQGKPDVVRFAYVYSPNDPYIAEIQIGHEFALRTFERDSLLAVKPELKNNLVSLWTNDFYPHMVEAILNGTTERNLRQEFLEIVQGKDEEIENNELRNFVLNLIAQFE